MTALECCLKLETLRNEYSYIHHFCRKFYDCYVWECQQEGKKPKTYKEILDLCEIKEKELDEFIKKLKNIEVDL